MVRAYWLVGREIVEVEQAGEVRASYGDEVIQRLSVRLAATHGKGISVRNLRNMRQFYVAFPSGSALAAIQQTPSAESDRRIQQTPSARSRAMTSGSKSPAALASRGATPPSQGLAVKHSAAEFPQELAWSHYLVLTRVVKPTARAFYEIEAARECWSVRQLERQIGSQLFERLANHRDPEAMRERGLEQAIIDRLEAFLLELGKGFCFVGRQKLLTVEGDHFYVDLVFYNRLLRCFVLIDLKLGKLTHQDLGQMLMYVNYYDRAQRAEHENKTIGVVLCSEQNAAMVKITLPENDQIIAATYHRYLPSEAELAAELEREREEAERVLRLTAPAMNESGES